MCWCLTCCCSIQHTHLNRKLRSVLSGVVNNAQYKNGAKWPECKSTVPMLPWRHPLCYLLAILRLQLEFTIRFSQSAYRCLWQTLLFTPAGCLGGGVWLVLRVVEGSRVSWADGTHGGTLDPLSPVCCALLDVSMHSHITALYKSCIGCYSTVCVHAFLSLCVQLDSVQEAKTIHTVSFWYLHLGLRPPAELNMHFDPPVTGAGGANLPIAAHHQRWRCLNLFLCFKKSL